MLEKVLISEQVVDTLLAATVSSRPWECCALIAGSQSKVSLTLSATAIVPNRAPAPEQFRILHKDFRRAEAQCSSTIRALYHSHERRLFLSREDVRSFFTDPLVWLVGVPQRSAEGEWSLCLRAFAEHGSRILAYDPELIRS